MNLIRVSNNQVKSSVSIGPHILIFVAMNVEQYPLSSLTS